MLDRISNYLPNTLGDSLENLGVNVRPELFPQEVRERLISSSNPSALEWHDHPRDISRRTRGEVGRKTMLVQKTSEAHGREVTSRRPPPRSKNLETRRTFQAGTQRRGNAHEPVRVDKYEVAEVARGRPKIKVRIKGADRERTSAGWERRHEPHRFMRTPSLSGGGRSAQAGGMRMYGSANSTILSNAGAATSAP